MAPNKKSGKGFAGKKTPNKGGKFSKRSMRREPSGVTRDERDEKYTGTPANDPRYYTVNPSLSALTAAIPIYPVLGMDLGVSSTANFTGGIDPSSDPSNFYTDAIPGMMGIALIPTFGSDLAYNSANASFNRLCANLYSAMVRDKSGTAPFDQAMVGHYLVCMRSAYIIVHDLKRFLSTVTYYQANNRYFPKGIGAAIGRNGYTLDASELDACVWQLNKFIRFLNTKFVPKMTVFLRDVDLYSRYYADSQTDQAQFYAFYPRGYYLWDDENNKSTFKPFGASVPNLPKDLASISELLTGIIDSIQNSDAFNVINAWMRHVFGAETGWTLEEMAIGAQPTFIYDEYILAQIENLHTVTMPSPTDLARFSIIQDGANNYLSNALGGSDFATNNGNGNVGLSCDPVFNYHISNPTEDLKLEASRLSVSAYSEELASHVGQQVTSTPSKLIFSDQVPVFLTVAYYNPVMGTYDQARLTTAVTVTDGVESDGAKEMARALQFKGHPIFKKWTAELTGDSVSGMRLSLIGDLDTVGTMDKAAYDRLNYTCTYSLFSVPGITT